MGLYILSLCLVAYQTPDRVYLLVGVSPTTASESRFFDFAQNDKREKYSVSFVFPWQTNFKQKKKPTWKDLNIDCHGGKESTKN